MFRPEFWQYCINTFSGRSMKGKEHKPLNDAEYMALAEFRYQIRRYLRYMEDRAREMGHNPQQYQVLLAIKGLPKDKSPTISAIAERMQLNHNSMVELVDRCEERGLLRRVRSVSDRRQVTLAITSEGEALMRQQAAGARQQLRIIGPILSESIQRLIEGTRAVKDSGESAGQRTGGKKKSVHE
jgi:DNA-binding MarR family transcriptional regulator